MGIVLPSPDRPTPTGLQLSAYRQDDGSTLYAVEILYSDDTWAIVATSKVEDEGWRLAGLEAVRRNVPLLPVSTFPGRAA